MNSENPALTPLNEPVNGIPDIVHDNISATISKLATGRGAFAIDTERADGIRYSNRAYLIQIKRENDEIFLIDPIGIESELTELAEIMHAEWILHAADQDLACLAELGLIPTKIFDTEIAALILGFERVSLQALVAEILGIALAKEYSVADWSMRPIPSEMRSYAALDVELLHLLKDELTKLLKKAGRYEWFLAECEETRKKKPPQPKKQPWRKTANKALIQDRRALAMLENMWLAREEIAKERDIAPNKLINPTILGELARRKPRSRADVSHSAFLRQKNLREFVPIFWTAIEKAWHTKITDLPERTYVKNHEPYPHLSKWEFQNPAGFYRWQKLRKAILDYSSEIGIRQDILLKPKIQKLIAWEGWDSKTDLSEKLTNFGARQWQISQCVPVILRACQ